MNPPEHKQHDKWVTTYSRERERTFFFYATILLGLVYGAQKLLHLW